MREAEDKTLRSCLALLLMAWSTWEVTDNAGSRSPKLYAAMNMLIGFEVQFGLLGRRARKAEL